jgi:hypothetical protein
MGILLVILARVLQWFFAPLFVIYAIVKLRNFKKVSDYFHNIAFGRDQLGNTMGGPLMNNLLLKNKSKAPKLYGNVDETISHITGVNFLAGNTTWLGNFVAKVLNKVDKNHVQNAAATEQDNTQEIKNG